MTLPMMNKRQLLLWKIRRRWHRFTLLFKPPGYESVGRTPGATYVGSATTEDGHDYDVWSVPFRPFTLDEPAGGGDKTLLKDWNCY